MCVCCGGGGGGVYICVFQAQVSIYLLHNDSDICWLQTTLAKITILSFLSTVYELQNGVVVCSVIIHQYLELHIITNSFCIWHQYV